MAKKLKLGNDLKEALLDYFYPIGSIYSTTSTIDPNIKFGGTWVKMNPNMTLWSSDSDENLGKTVGAGLPNITGYLELGWGDDSAAGVIMNRSYGGALYASQRGYSWYAKAGGQGWYNNTVNIDASRSSNIYGKSTTVQPPAMKCNIWIRTA